MKIMTMSARELKTWPYPIYDFIRDNFPGDITWSCWKAELKFRRKIGIVIQFKYY